MKVNACRKKTRAPRKAASGKRAQERVKLEELQQINLHRSEGVSPNYVLFI